MRIFYVAMISINTTYDCKRLRVKSRIIMFNDRTEFQWPKYIPVLHNLQPTFVSVVAEVLIESKISACSVSMRHPSAMSSLRTICSTYSKDFLVGCSTIVNYSQVIEALSYGSHFISTTHFSPQLVEASNFFGMPMLCGVSDAKDVENALPYNISALKFYPSTAIPPMLIKDILNSDPFKGTLRKPTIFAAGGVQLEDIATYVSAGVDGFAMGFDCSNQDRNKLMEYLQRANFVISAQRDKNKISKVY